MSEFNGHPSDAVAVGICVVLGDDGEIIYAGPIKGSPDVSGRAVLMNTSDFEKFREFVVKRRH